MSIVKNYHKTRQFTETLCSHLELEDYTPQSAVFASPPKWHIAHTTWFFEEMILKRYVDNYQVFDDRFCYIFNSYYNSLGERIERHNRGLITRPSVTTIYQYRSYVDEHITSLLKSNHSSEIKALITLGINHEQQHQELIITDLKYTFSLNPLYPKFAEKNYVSNVNEDNGWQTIKEDIYTIGHQNKSFCFDNELKSHKVFLEAFKISKALVTNGNFINFIDDGGYENPKYWLDSGWEWLTKNNIQHPLYWKRYNNSWQQYTLSGIEELNYDHILSHVSFFEAFAYAQWTGYRLPTEFEWEIAAKFLNWGQRWEWTNSAYLPYPNFKIAEGALGEYNGKFMVNQMVLRGASSATPHGHSRYTYRNFFPAETRWQFSGIRLAKHL